MDIELEHALKHADLPKLRELISAGVALDSADQFGDYPLMIAIDAIDDEESRHAAVEMLLAAGADPKLIDQSGGGPLFCAVHRQDTETMRMLLLYRADPRLEHDMGEPIYSWAEFDYRYETYQELFWNASDFNSSLPEKPADSDKESEENWLAFLDRIAVKYGKRRPDYLILLRQHGAPTSLEIGQPAGLGTGASS